MYSDDTSRVHRRALCGRLSPMLEIIRKKSGLSLTKDGILGTSGCKKWSTSCEIRSVGELFPDMIGLPGGGFIFLWG